MGGGLPAILCLGLLTALPMGAQASVGSPLEARLAEQEQMLETLGQKLSQRRRKLRDQAYVFHRLEKRAGRHVSYVWSEVPTVHESSRDLSTKLLSLGIKEGLREVEILEHRLLEVQAETEWLRIQRDEGVSSNPDEGAQVSESQPVALRCQTPPARAPAKTRLRVLEGFGTKKDALSGLEWNTLGWWLGGGVAGDVRACAEGTVAFVGQVNGRGRVVMLDHGSGNMTLYANLREQEAEPLARGTRIASGVRLGSAAERFYFEVRHGGRPVDPAGVLPEGTFTF